MASFILKTGKHIAAYILTPKAYVKLNYRMNMHRKLNLNHPQTFNEKLQWMKLYDHNPLYPKMVDKSTAKDYVDSVIGKGYTIPTYGVWDSPDKIDFDSLPDKFVMKTTHDSGGIVFCRDRKNFDVEKAKSKLRKSLDFDYYRYSREWPYKTVKPRIIAEQLLEIDKCTGCIPDYKVLCFGGVPKLIEYHLARYTEKHTQDFYSPDWKLVELSQGNVKMSGKEADKPVVLKEMLELSAKLSSGFPHVRVDWYSVDDRLYFGELTLFDSSGTEPFYPEHWDRDLGDLIILPCDEVRNQV